MHKTTLYLDDAMYANLQRLAQNSGKTQASLIREALHEFTAAKSSRPRSIGAGKSGKRSLSEKTQALLDGFGES